MRSRGLSNDLQTWGAVVAFQTVCKRVCFLCPGSENVWRCGRTLAPRGVDRGSRSIAWRARSGQLSTRSKRFVNTSDPGAENQPTRVSCALGLRFGSTSFRYRKLNKRRRRKLNKQNKRLRSCVSKRFANKSVIWVGTGDFGTV